jgi:hypothetical protein
MVIRSRRITFPYGPSEAAQYDFVGLLIAAVVQGMFVLQRVLLVL